MEQLLSCTQEAEWTRFQTHYCSENLVALGIEPGTSGSVARRLEGGRSADNSEQWIVQKFGNNCHLFCILP
jgi:hypothetical protein